MDRTRAPVAFGQRAVPQLFSELRWPEADRRHRALTSLCDLMHDPERLYQAVRGGFLSELDDLLQDEDSSVRTKTCELLHLMTNHSIGRQALLASSLLPPVAQLLDDPSSSCRMNVHRVLNGLTLQPAGVDALLSLVPKLMLKLGEDEDEEEEEVQVLLLATITCCSRLDARPALNSKGVSLLARKLTHPSNNICREAAGAMMALSVPGNGKQRVCEEMVLPVLVKLLHHKDVEVQANAAGAIMNTVILTIGKLQCLDLDVISILLRLVSEQRQREDEEQWKKRKVLIIYCLRALTSLAEAPPGRSLLLRRLPLLTKRSEYSEKDDDIRRAAQTAVNVVTWTP